MDDNMRNAWLDMISKVYSNLHNSDRVLKASNVSDKKRERLLKYSIYHEDNSPKLFDNIGSLITKFIQKISKLLYKSKAELHINK